MGDIIKLFKIFNIDIGMKELQQMFTLSDKNKDSALDYPEFFSFVTSSDTNSIYTNWLRKYDFMQGKGIQSMSKIDDFPSLSKLSEFHE